MDKNIKNAPKRGVFPHLRAIRKLTRTKTTTRTALGTVGELAMITAFMDKMWDELIHLRCTLHMEGNFKKISMPMYFLLFLTLRGGGF